LRQGWRLLSLLSLALIPWAPLGAAELRTIYQCSATIDNLAGEPGRLTLAKTFFEDGTVRNVEIRWQDGGGAFIRGHEAPAEYFATLGWAQADMQPADPIDWTRGSVSVTHYGYNLARRRSPMRGEAWGQVIVDRDRMLRVYESEGMRMLLPDSAFILASGLVPLTVNAQLGMSIDALVAWGTDARVVTDYETMVQRRPSRPNLYSNNIVGRRRIIGSYDVDTAALARKAAQVRAAAERWLATLGDFRIQCERGVEEDEANIVVT
jgi:hypothetical protein